MDYKRKLYRELAGCVDARLRCKQAGNDEWFGKHTETIEQLLSDLLPHGAGWDNATSIDLEHSTGEKLVVYGAFHHMDENGFYDGWTEHTITVRPSLIHGISLSISGRDRNEIKEYLYDIFSSDLTQMIDWDEESKRWKRVKRS